MFALVFAGEAIYGLPFVLVRIFRPTVLDVLELDNTQLGTAFSAYGVVAMISYFLGGPLADRFPARRLMTFALLATSLGGIGFWMLPGMQGLTVLYAYFGLTTILPFWAALLRATREWGGHDAQGRAYGLLDGGRGLVAALVTTLSVGVFASMLPDADTAALEVKRRALQSAIVYFTIGTALAAGAVWWLVPEKHASEEFSEHRIDLAQIGRVLKMPTLWLQASIVVCAYVGYKGTDDFSLLARDALGYDDVEAAALGTVAFWVRPFAAIGAGILADRFERGSTVLVLGFALLVVAEVLVATTTGVLGLAGMLLAGLMGTAAFVYALRGVYFAVFDEGHVPAAVTGTAVGVVSVIGYTPDIFMGPAMGLILDGYPGVTGHQYFFALLAAFSAVGLGVTLAFRAVAASTDAVNPTPAA